MDVLMTARSINVNLVGCDVLKPLALLSIKQPHTIICTKSRSERLEISFYDLQLRVSSPGVQAKRGLLVWFSFKEWCLGNVIGDINTYRVYV